MISAAVIVLVIRSRRPFFKSRPGTYLLAATALVVTATVLFPYTPLGEFFNFQLPHRGVPPGDRAGVAHLHLHCGVGQDQGLPPGAALRRFHFGKVSKIDIF